MKGYTATYEGQTMAGVPGFWWRLYQHRKLIAEGWSAGKKRHAEEDANLAIIATEFRRAA